MTLNNSQVTKEFVRTIEFDTLIPANGFVGKQQSLGKFINKISKGGLEVEILLNEDASISCIIDNNGSRVVNNYQKMIAVHKRIGIDDQLKVCFKLVMEPSGKKIHLFQDIGIGFEEIYLKNIKPKDYIIHMSKVEVPPLNKPIISFLVNLPLKGGISRSKEIIRNTYGHSNQNTLIVNIDELWRINCLIYRPNNNNSVHIFQKMQLQDELSQESGEALCDFTIIIANDNIELINRVGMMSYKIELEKIKDEVYVLPVLHYSKENKYKIADINPDLIKDGEDRRFVFKVKELYDRLNKVESKFEEEYNLIEIGGILRKFLLDDGGSLGPISRKWEHKLRYEVIYEVRKLRGNAQAVKFNLDPHVTHGLMREELKIDAFMSTLAGIFNGTEVTVRDVIKAVANGKGAVHSRLKKTEITQNELLNYDSYVSLFGQEYSLSIIREIANVTLRAVDPMIEKIASVSQ